MRSFENLLALMVDGAVSPIVEGEFMVDGTVSPIVGG